VVRIEGDTARDDVLEALRQRGVNAAVHYPTPIHLQPAARPWGFGPGDFPNAEQLSREVLCLPVHPFLGEDEVQRVIEALLTAAG
jgi:dTDP-4-amino-4,6-dideoxygalactose transaminase